jgi:glycerol uptake facilitator protein
MADVTGEFLGTMILILLGDGVVAGVLLARTKSHAAGWLVVTTGWAFAVLAGILTAKACGAPGYINPVGPLVAALFDKPALAADKAVSYVVAEFAGAFAGAVLVWLHYTPHWRESADPGVKLAVFCTGPAIRNFPANVLSEVVGTFVLVFVASAVVANKGLATGLDTTFVATIVWAIGLCLGGTTGYAINPARDLGPRCAHAVLPIPGKGPSDWEYAWVPVVGPVIGAVVAGAVATVAFV